MQFVQFGLSSVSLEDGVAAFTVDTDVERSRLLSFPTSPYSPVCSNVLLTFLASLETGLA